MKTVVPATAELLARYYESRPDRRPKMTTRSVVALRDGEPVGVGGFYVDASRVVLFGDLTDELRQDRRLLVKGYRKVLEMARGFGLRIHSLADPEIEGSATLLEHMGGRYIGDDLYEFDPKGAG